MPYPPLFFIFEVKKLKDGFNIDIDYADALPDEDIKAPKPTLAGELLEWLEVLCFAIIAVVIAFCFIFRIATVDGNSMKNTLHNGDKVIISNFNYKPKQGDIVVVSRNNNNSLDTEKEGDEPIIKRIIAVGGQTVNIDFEKGIVYVDGVALEEKYLGSPTYDKGDVDFPLYIPKGHVFLMGDNRGDSLDSRSSRIGNGGVVDERYILGHAVYRFFPLNQVGALD
ncbi:MAG: signal peptidase I [Clostridia bacterium]|nr:signal peptidase I [Clostridia bacterium]